MAVDKQYPVPRVATAKEMREQWRIDPRYSDWKEEVFRRHHGRCAVTGIHNDDAELHHHHTYSGYAYPDYRYDANEGVLMLAEIHRDFHSANGGSGSPVTRQMWDNWIAKNAHRYTDKYSGELGISDRIALAGGAVSDALSVVVYYWVRVKYVAKVAMFTALIFFGIINLILPM